MQLFQQSEATAAYRIVYLFCVDATDGLTPETGEDGGQPQLSKAGGGFVNTSDTLHTLTLGHYYVTLIDTELNTLGPIRVRYKSANTAESYADGLVVAFDPYAAAGLGLTNLDTTVSSRAAEAGGNLATALSEIQHATYGLAALETLVDELESRLTATRAGNLDELGALNVPADIDTLLSRLTALRAGYLDNLSAGAVALEATLTAIKGAGWSAETLKAIKDAIDALNDPAASAIADAVWDELLSGHTTSGSAGDKLGDVPLTKFEQG